MRSSQTEHEIGRKNSGSKEAGDDLGVQTSVVHAIGTCQRSGAFSMPEASPLLKKVEAGCRTAFPVDGFK
jgi:hypothetical protein